MVGMSRILEDSAHHPGWALSSLETYLGWTSRMVGMSRILAPFPPWRTVPTTQAGHPSLETYLG